jgi:hypothetical protein
MNNIFSISIRLMSDTYDFDNLKDKMIEYKIVYHKKGESTARGELAENPLFRTLTNVFLVKNVCKISNLDDIFNEKSLKQIVEILENIVIDEHNDLKKEILISAQIYHDQFGFDISRDFVKYLSDYGYSIGFSSVIHL